MKQLKENPRRMITTGRSSPSVSTKHSRLSDNEQVNENVVKGFTKAVMAEVPSSAASVVANKPTEAIKSIPVPPDRDDGHLVSAHILREKSAAEDVVEEEPSDLATNGKKRPCVLENIDKRNFIVCGPEEDQMCSSAKVCVEIISSVTLPVNDHVKKSK